MAIAQGSTILASDINLTNRYQIISYRGNDLAAKMLTFNFSPTLVFGFLEHNGQQQPGFVLIPNFTYIYLIASHQIWNYDSVSWNGSSIQLTASSSNQIGWFNSSAYTYYIVAIG